MTVLAVRVTVLERSSNVMSNDRGDGVSDAPPRRAGGVGMTTVAVVAHTRKQLGGGLSELREVLAAHGVDAPLWYEVSKSKQAPKRAPRRARGRRRRRVRVGW